MLQLTQPIWLWAGTAVMIPLLLHLWNIRQGKVLQVGSIQLMQQHARQASLNRRLTDIPLLLLRCLLILLVALMLAKPVWIPRDAGGKKGWVLVAPDYSEQTYRHFKPAIDSLLQLGFELRYFNGGFAPIDTAGFTAPVTTDDDKQYGNYWAQLAQLETTVPPGTPVYIYSINELRHFSGNRPVMPPNVHWFTFTPVTKARQYIAKAWLQPATSREAGDPGTIRIALAHSTPATQTYTYHTIPRTLGEHDSFTVRSSQNGKWSVSLREGASAAIDTTVCRIALYTGDYPQDAKYVQAAITAIQSSLQQPIQLVTFNSNPPPAESYRWLIWLSAKPIPAALHADNILTYHSGKTSTANSVLQTGYPMQPVTLRQYNIVTTPEDSLHVFWRNGWGQPILYSTLNQPHYYQLTTRFSPSWNTLTWNTGFPALLARLLLEGGIVADAISPADIRTIDSAQLQPQTSSTLNLSHGENNSIPLQPLCWLLAMIVLLCERLLAHKNKGGAHE